MAAKLPRPTKRKLDEEEPRPAEEHRAGTSAVTGVFNNAEQREMWKKKFKKFSTQQRLYEPSQVTLMVQWRDWKHGFRHQDEVSRVLCNTLAGNSPMYISATALESEWYWFGPITFRSHQSWLDNFKDNNIHPPAVPANLHKILHTLACADASTVCFKEKYSPRKDVEGNHGRPSSDDTFTVMDGDDCDQIASLYWKATRQQFHKKKAKVFSKFLLEKFFKLYFKVETEVDYSTSGHDSEFDRIAYTCAGPTPQEGEDLFHTPVRDRDAYLCRCKSSPLVLPLDNTTQSKVTSDVFVWSRGSLILLAEVGSQFEDPEVKQRQMDRHLLHYLSVPDRAPTLIGWVVQPHGILLCLYHMDTSTKEIHRVWCDTLFQYKKVRDMESLAKLMHCMINGDKFVHIHKENN